MSVSPNTRNPENRLLAALPQEEYQRLLPKLENVFVDLKQVLYAPDEPIEHVYFPKNSVGSLLTLMEDGKAVEVGTVGNEGMVGLAVFLGAKQVPGLSVGQIPGNAMRMRADVFKREVTPETPLHNLLQRYTQALFNQISQTAACNSLHSIEQRCCRWLLMTQDRVESDEFPLTQEFLSQMLSVRRASVSVVAATLQKAGLIDYTRGRIRVIDRQGLEDCSCECYGIVKREFERLIGDN